MKLSNYHSHFKLDDGVGELSEYAEKAINCGLEIIGVSPHAPLPFKNEWTLTNDGLSKYLDLMKDFKASYNEQLEIYTGLEIDFIPGKITPADSDWDNFNLEYKIGSVHSIYDSVSEKDLSVDGPVSELVMLLENRFKGDIRQLIREYFSLEIQMIELGGFDILGHCDLVKKRNKNNRFFDQDEKWYREAALEMLQAASKANVIVEVNTGGLSRKATTEVYPSPWMLERCLELNIPLTISSDAHQPKHLDFYFQESIELLKSIGYGEIYFFSGRNWQSQPII